jgi:hypothetical protein
MEMVVLLQNGCTVAKWLYCYIMVVMLQNGCTAAKRS